MVDRAAIESEVRDSVSVVQTGRWYIAEGEYDGFSTAAQGESRAQAVRALVKRFCERERDAETREAARERRETHRERRDKLAAARDERVVEREQEYLEQLREHYLDQ